MTAGAVALMVTLPLVAFFFAPSARADSTPGANLAGINVSAVAEGEVFEPLTPGLVGAGDVAEGNLFEVAVPYAASTTSTGPSSTGVASPLYPGPTAAQLGTVISTFRPLPGPMQQALNDPVLASSDYPPQAGTGSSATYTPPGGSAAGAGTASSNATEGGVTSSAATSDTVLPSSLVEIASSTATSTTQVLASSVASTAHTTLGTIKLLGGAVTISGISSDASATSDGNSGQQTNDLKIGSVTVAGQKAYIDNDGLHLAGASQGATLAPTLNQVVGALAQAGLAVRTISPTETLDGTSAAVTSGALQISFLDRHIPNPGGRVPVNTAGFDLDLGLSQAAADATALPPIPPFDSGGFGASTGPGAGSVSAAGPVSGTVSGPVTGAMASPGALAAAGSAAPVQPGAAQAQAPAGAAQAQAPASIDARPAALLGMPVKAAWVVIACLLSLVAAGPLLACANWQLLRGRKT